MGKRKKAKRTQGKTTPAPTTSLGGLMGEMGFAASKPTITTPAATPTASAFDFANQQKVVLRMERKGRGGKTVTVVSHLRGNDTGRTQVARELRRALGCGARVEGENIIVQGDVRDRARTWLEKQGVKKVIG